MPKQLTQSGDFHSERYQRIGWIVNYLVDERFSPKHLDALAHIIGLFNDCEDAEHEVFEFAEKLYQKYAG
jgi:hypothetical protein